LSKTFTLRQRVHSSPSQDLKSSAGFLFSVARKYFLALIFSAICLFLVYSALLTFHSAIIGLYKNLHMNTWQVQQMQHFYREFEKDIDSMDFQAFKEREKKKLWFEVQALNALEPFVQALDKAQQFED